MPCVCSHPQNQHQTTTLSVPIGTQSRIIYGQPAQTTYTTDQCHCGCTTYLEDNEPDTTPTPTWTWVTND